MRRRLLELLLLSCVLGGCASRPAAPPPLVESRAFFPTEAFIIQRVMFTVQGEQYPLNGYLALSETRGKRLVLMDTFGIVADVLIKPDGQVFVMKSSRMFSARCIRQFMAADVQCVFGGRTMLDCPVSSPAPNEYVIDRGGRYQLDMRILQVKPGRQPDTMFDKMVQK